jgi:hypothetical protein
VHPLGRLEDWPAEEDPSEWADYLGPSAVWTEELPVGPGIRDTAAELLAYRVRYGSELTQLVVPAGPESVWFAAICADIRDGLVLLAGADRLEARRHGADINTELATVEDLAGIDAGAWVIPLTAAEAAEQRHRLQILTFPESTMDFGQPPQLVEVAPAGPARADLDGVSTPVLRTLDVLLDSSHPIPLHQLRPALGIDSPHLATTLDLARRCLLELYHRGVATLWVVPALAASPAADILADDGRWSSWSTEVCVDINAAVGEAIGEARDRQWRGQPSDQLG